MKDRTTTYIALIIGGLAFIQFVVLPTIRNRTSTQVIGTILSDWQASNTITPMTYWANRNQYPNLLPRLVTYKIRNRQVLKKDGKLHARFTITLNFEENPAIPQNSDWLFVLNKIQGGWKVVDFRMSKLHPSDIQRQASRYDAVADRNKLQEMERDRNATIRKAKEDKEQQKTPTVEP
ncbi:MAG: hypothetical protein K8I00_05340, partial [Candidatus Omnitrophica bacterium]|nr:hypothetical protein [Candidatus Omnitrophota bacterium]